MKESDAMYVLGALGLLVLTAFVAPFASLAPKSELAKRYDDRMREVGWWDRRLFRGDGKPRGRHGR